jgi:hypothetical protein
MKHIAKRVMGTAALAACALAQYAYAGTIDPFNNGDMSSPVTQVSQVQSMLISVVKWTYTIFFVMAVFFILLAAYNFITAQGDEKKIGAARKQLKYAAIGIAVALLASGMSLLVRGTIQELSSGSSSAPSAPQGPGI